MKRAICFECHGPCPEDAGFCAKCDAAFEKRIAVVAEHPGRLEKLPQTSVGKAHS